MTDGALTVNGIEVRYMPPRDLMVTKGLKYVDVFGLLPLLQRLCFEKQSNQWDPVNMLLTGPKGTGKSLALAYFAQENEIPYLSLDCSESTRERHLRGGFVVKSGTTPFVLGTAANAVRVANEFGKAMLVLEEINALQPQIQKELNPLTDFRKKLEIPELSWRLELEPHARLFIAGTLNPSVYGGTYELNEDLKSRFFELDIPYPPEVQEKQILKAMMPAGVVVQDDTLDKLITIAQNTRQKVSQYALSPRDLVDLVKAIQRVGYEEALFLAGQKFSIEDRKLVLERIKDATNITVHESIVDLAKANKRIL